MKARRLARRTVRAAPHRGAVGREVAALDTLQELNRGYIRSVQNSDVRWFDEHLSDDFVNSNPDCSFVDRAGFLTQIARPCPVSGLAIEDVRIQMLGGVAIIRARTTYVKPDGQQGGRDAVERHRAEVPVERVPGGQVPGCLLLGSLLLGGLVPGGLSGCLLLGGQNGLLSVGNGACC